jgi:hypothetical protein
LLCDKLILIYFCLPCKMQVRRISDIRNRNIVTLIGYCQEVGLQMLVFEHLPNGSVCGHLYGNPFTY